MNEIVVSTLMPIRRAASGSWAVARMARPIRELRDEVHEHDHERDRDHGGEHVAVADVDAEDVVKSMSCESIRSGTLVVRAAEPQQADVLQDEREADRGDQRRQLGRVPQWPVGHALDHHVERAAGDHRRSGRMSSSAEERASRPVAVVRPIVPIMPKATNDPIMNTSPWAKLMSSMMP